MDQVTYVFCRAIPTGDAINSKRTAMQKFEKLTKPEELDFFQIYEEHGVKFIHIFGYIYHNEGYWANMECDFFIEKLEDFVRHMSENKDYVDDSYCDFSQYQDDHSEEEILETINTYFDGKPADYRLSFANVTTDTPCGNYVS